MTAHVLIAEDDEQTREFYREGFPDFAIDTVTNGIELLKAASDKPYRLILTDISMPFLNGIDAVRKIRQDHGPNQNTCICALSGDRSELTKREVGISGFDYCYEKPLRPQIITSLLLWASEPNMPRELIPDEGAD